MRTSLSKLVTSLSLCLVLAAALLVPLHAGAVDFTPPPTFTDPLGGTTLSDFIRNIILWLVGIVGLLAMLAIVWGGIMYIVSFGNEPRLQLAKKIVIWAIVGLIIVMLAYVIIAVVGSLIGVTAPPTGP